MDMNVTYWWTPYPEVRCIGPLYVLVALEVACLVPSFIINAVLFYVLTTNNEHFSQNVFAKSMTAADLLISGLCQPLFVASILYIERTDSIVVATIQRCTFILTSAACAGSVSSLTSLCVQRYVQIVYPFKYLRIFTPFRLRASLVLIWVSSIVSLTAVFIKGLDMMIFYLLVLSIIVFILLAFVSIYLHTVRIIRRLILPSGSAFAPASSRKATRNNAVSITVFAALWLPFTVIGVLCHNRRKTQSWVSMTGTYTCDARATVYATLFLYSILLAHVHSLLNPIIHTLRNSYIKAAVAALMRRSVAKICGRDSVGRRKTSKPNAPSNRVKRDDKTSTSTAVITCFKPDYSPFKLRPNSRKWTDFRPQVNELAVHSQQDNLAVHRISVSVSNAWK